MLSVTKARTFPRPGRPGRSRHDGRRPDQRPRHSARKGAAAVSVARVNARERYVERRGTGRSFPPVLESGEAVPAMTTRDVRDWRMSTVKAAPADEARAVHRTRRSDAPALRKAESEDFAVDARATPRSSKPGMNQSKLAGANS